MDLHIQGHLVATPAVVSGQSGFVSRLTRDVAAGEEEIANRVHVGVRDDASTGSFDGFDGGAPAGASRRCRRG